MAIYFFIDFASRVIGEFVFIVSPEAAGSQRLYLPHFAQPTLYLFAAAILWFYSPAWSQKTFPTSSAAQAAGSSVVPKTLARLLGIYLIAGSFSVVVDFVIRVIARSSDVSGIFWSAPASWSDFGASFVWLVTGLLMYFGADKLTGAVKGVGNAIADDLWRIKPEDDEPKTQA
jgi:hypothetical protein